MSIREKAEIWLKVLAIAIAGMVVAVFFVHLFLLLTLVGILVVLGIWLAERILGPDVRVRLNLPPAFASSLRFWERRPRPPGRRR